MIGGTGDAATGGAPKGPGESDLRALEAEHRIKNHLQLLASYARQASRKRGLTAGELAEDLSDKLIAIAGAHDALYQAGGAERAPALAFLQTLLAAFPAAPHIAQVDCDAELRLPAEELAPIGMIVSEAVSNALKHAFPTDRPGSIWLSLVEACGRVHLTIRDDGVGLPDRPLGRVSGKGLIEALARQLGGSASIGNAPEGGTVVSVVYPRRDAGTAAT